MARKKKNKEEENLPENNENLPEEDVHEELVPKNKFIKSKKEEDPYLETSPYEDPEDIDPEDPKSSGASKEQEDWVMIALAARKIVLAKLTSSTLLEAGEISSLIESLHRVLVFHQQSLAFDKTLEDMGGDEDEEDPF